MGPPASGERGGFALADRDARDRAAGATAEDRRGRLLVEAAAGTGKTTVLLSRVLAYVVSGDLPLAEIAIVTFTEAAAAELKVRLRRELGARLAALDAGGAAEAEDARAVRSRLLAALADLETAAVGTIHSFCFELLKERPVEAALDPGFTVADELDRRLLMTRAWEELLRRMDPDEPGLAAAYDLGLAREVDLRAIAFGLVDVDPDRLPRPLAGFEDDLAERWRAIGDALREAASAAERSGALRRHVGRALDAFRELDRLPPRERWAALLAGELKVARRGGKASERHAKRLRDEARAGLDEALARIAHQRLAELARWLCALSRGYRALAGREARLDFDQLIARTVDTLRRHPELLADFRRQYPVLMVDEFQDTDPMQVELLLLLAGEGDEPADEGPRSLFLVGDPKQSIYRFRGADLELYHRVQRERIGRRRTIYLSQTFRPLPALADWVNEVMARVMRPAASGPTGPPEEPDEPWEVTYRPLHPRPIASLPTGEAPGGSGVVYLGFDPSSDGGVEADREAEAEALARFAHRTVIGGAVEVRDHEHRPRPARWGDIALLLPKMTVLETYERTFHRYGIPFRVVGGRHYYRRDEVHALIQILKALSDPGDPIAAVAALRGPGFGLSDSELVAYALCRPRPRFDAAAAADAVDPATSPDPKRARRVVSAIAALDRLRRETAGLPLPELVAAVIEALGLVPFFALRDRAEQRVANLRKVVSVARRVEAGGVPSLAAFVRWLESLLEDEPEESDSPTLEGSGSAVRLMTVHRAKGLEFPIVLLGGVPSGGSRGGDRLRVLPAEGGAEDGGRVALYLSRERATLGWEAAKEADDRREEAETKRLLYVAATRARDLLVLPLPSGELDRRRLDPLFGLLYAAGAGRPEEVAAEHRRIAAADLPAPPVAARTVRVDRERLEPGSGRALLAERRRRLAAGRASSAEGPLRPSAGEARIGPPTEPPIEPPIEPPVEPPVEPAPTAWSAAATAGRRIGILAHRRIARELGGAAEEDGEGADPKELAAAETLAERFLSSALCARARRAGERLVEQPLTVRLAGARGDRLVEGKLDLAFLEDGGWVVVDYKGDRLRPGEEAERAERYREQLRLYLEALAAVSGKPAQEGIVFFLATGEASVIAPATR